MNTSTIKDFDPDALRQSFTMVGLDYAAPSPTNPRKSFPEGEMADLVESIKAHGLLQPILVRHWPLTYPQPGPLVTYEIVAGERRWRAAKLAGLTMIEAKHRELTDLEVLEIQIIENLQRADLHPLEEAEGYERIMATHAYTVEQLGKKIGKSRSYIFGRLKLLALDDEARRLFRGGLLNASTALLVARVPTTALRAKAIKEITEPNYNGDILSVRQAHEVLKRRFMLKLDEAPFPTHQMALTDAGSCEACPKRTGNAPDLFDDIDSPDVCTDPDCFIEKKIEWRDIQARKVSEAGGKVIIGDEAKKLAPYGIENYTDLKGYTKLDKTCHDDPEKRTFREIIGDDAEPVAIEDVRLNVMVPVIPNSILAEKMLAAGVKMREEEIGKGNAKVDVKLALERATRGRMFELLRENIEVLASEGGGFAFPVQAELFRAVVQRLWDRADFELHARIANLWATSGKNNTERIERFGGTIPSMDDNECWTLATDLLFCHSTVVASEWDLNNGGKQLIAFASRFDIDEGETRKFVQDELKAKEKEAKPVNKTVKKGKNLTPAEAPYPLNAAQAGELTAENAAYPAGDMTIGQFKNLPAEAAQASDQNPEGETPSAVADLIEMEEKTSPRFNQVRYVHPENSDLTWTGRGRKPKWVEAWLTIAGNTLDMLTPVEEKQSSASSDANEKASLAEPSFEKYQPSNSSEGEAFFDYWCRRCTKDKAMSEGLDPDQCDDDEKCEIIGDSMLYRLDSPSYPSEWRYDQAGHPVCTAFSAVGDAPAMPRCTATVDMFQGEESEVLSLAEKRIQEVKS